MPPKSKSKGGAAAAAAAAAPATSPFVSAERVLLRELHNLQSSHLQQRSHGPATWASAVAQLTRQGKELEESVAKLHELQHQQHQRDRETHTGTHAQERHEGAPASPIPPADASSTLAAVSALSLSPLQSHLTDLASWLQREAPQCLYDSHWQFDGMASLEEGTGVKAVRKMEKGELFMSIPRTVMMTSDGLASSSPVGRYLASDPLCLQNPSLLLAVCLLYERAKGDASYWAPYIRCLPRRFNLPLLWSVDEVREHLQVSPAVFDVLSLQRSHVRHYVHLHEALTKGGFLQRHAAATAAGSKTDSSAPAHFSFSWSGFTWAVCVLMSRQNQVPPPVLSKKAAKDLAAQHAKISMAAAAAGMPPPPPLDRPSVALIPGFDSCNHRGTGSIATFFDVDSQQSECHTMEPVDEGAPIYLYYGPRRNAHLLIYAGFVDATHRSDEMMFELSVDGKPWATAMPLVGAEAAPAASTAAAASTPEPVDPLLKIKLMLLKKAGMNSSGFQMKLPLPEPVSGFGGGGGGGGGGASAPPADGASAEDASRALAQAQEAKQAARQHFRALQHFLRVACLDSKEKAALALKHKPDGFGNPLHPSFHFLPSLYPSHDLDAFTFLHDALSACLHTYPTTLAQDESDLLRDEATHAAQAHEPDGSPGQPPPHAHPQPMGRRQRLGLELRRAEKRMLHAAITKAMQWKQTEQEKVEKAALAQQQKQTPEAEAAGKATASE